MLVCSILNEKLEIYFFFRGEGDSDFPGLHLHNGAKTQLPEDGVWRVVTMYYFVIVQFCFLFQDTMSAVYRGL